MKYYIASRLLKWPRLSTKEKCVILILGGSAHRDAQIKQPDALRLLVKQIYKAPDEATARWLLNTLPSQSDTK